MNPAFTSPVGPRVTIDGREYDYFAGTGYLGLQNHPTVIQAVLDGVQRYGLSTATSRGGYGEHLLYTQVEQNACSFFGAEKALYFASGYLGSAILMQGLQGEFERIFFDESAHFSILEALRGCSAPAHAFAHLDTADLQTALRRELRPGERPLVFSDGLFPISGEIAPLPDLLQAVEEAHGWVALDDAHAAGVLGPHGRGSPDYFGLANSPRLAVSATLSKALGGYGGIITGTAVWIERLQKRARSLVGASPPPLPAAAASAQALAIAYSQPQLRRQLTANVAQARSGLRRLGWPLADSPSPILCLGIRPGCDLAQIKADLMQRDICIAHVTSYSSTPPGGALRIAIFATHTREQIERMVQAFADIVQIR